MGERIRLVLRRIRYNLRGGFLVRPLIITLILGALGAFLSFLEELVPGFSDFVPKLLFPSHADPQVAQIILGGIATSIMTVVSIVFAILLMTLTLASMQFSPRIIVSFSRDRVTQWTLGVFLGTFSYCMAALPAAHSTPEPFAPVATVLGAMLLALFATVLGRAAFVQILDRSRLSRLERDQTKRELLFAPRRGLIEGRNGEPLAVTRDVDSVFVYLFEIQNGTGYYNSGE